MSIDLQAAKQNLLTLKEEYETRIDKIEDHIQNPQDDLNEHWEDQAISYRQNDMRTNLMVEARQSLIYVENAQVVLKTGLMVNVKSAVSKLKNSAYKHCLTLPYVWNTLNNDSFYSKTAIPNQSSSDQVGIFH